MEQINITLTREQIDQIKDGLHCRINRLYDYIQEYTKQGETECAKYCFDEIREIEATEELFKNL